MSSAGGKLRSAAALGLVALVGTGLLTGVRELTAERIEEQERRALARQLEQVLTGVRYDNDLLQDRVALRDEAHFPGGQEVLAYRARRGGRPVAVVLRFDAPDGYNGRISLVAGVGVDGRLAGVRVVSHRETPGLGDGIEAERSDWIRSFEGRSLADPRPGAWTVRREGGAFDQFTGATITPRAVVHAVRRALQYHALHGPALFASPAPGEGENR